jgi:hypothetical protein
MDSNKIIARIEEAEAFLADVGWTECGDGRDQMRRGAIAEYNRYMQMLADKQIPSPLRSPD